MKYRPPVPRQDIATRPFRTVSKTRFRERRISITSSLEGKAIQLQACTHDGAPLGGPLFISDREAAEVIGALVEAAAAMGVSIPAAAPPAVHLDTSGGALPPFVTGRTRGTLSPENSHA